VHSFEPYYEKDGGVTWEASGFEPPDALSVVGEPERASLIWKIRLSVHRVVLCESRHGLSLEGIAWGFGLWLAEPRSERVVTNRVAW
jgi:hypothetical protein